MSKVENSSASAHNDVALTTKFEVKHAFGCQVAKVDPVLTFSATSGDKDYSDRLVFKVGKQACIFNPETGKQDFFDRPKQCTDVLHYCISSNNRFISMCETGRNDKTGEFTSHVAVYSLSTLNRLKVLSHSLPKPFVCSTFCGDPKMIAALSDEPDRHIVVWQWEKEKLFKSVALHMNVSCLRSAPHSMLMLTTTGHGILKCWGMANDATIKSNTFLPPAKEASENFLDHVWLPSSMGLHKMVALADAEAGHENAANRTRRQNVYIFEGRDNQHMSIGGTPSVPTMPIVMELKQTLVLKLELGSCIEKIIASSKVFCLVGSFGLCVTYERTDDKHDPYVESRRISLGDKHLVGGAIYPSDEKMVLVTKNSRMFSMAMDVTIDQIKLSSAGNAADDASAGGSMGDDQSQGSSLAGSKMEKKGAHGVMDLTPGGHHCATILGADLAYERPLMITIGADCMARVWNFNTMKCEVTHDFGNDEPISVAFHSSGFQVLVSFKDRIRLYNVLMDKLRECKEAVLKNCKCLKFSNGSQYWAAASAINVVVYETKSFQQLMTFQGHMMSVTRLCWAPGDQVLFSAGMDGNVYGWPIAQTGRVDVIAASNRSSLILDLEVDSVSTVFQVAPRDAEDDNNGNSSDFAASAAGAGGGGVGFDSAKLTSEGAGEDRVVSSKERNNLIVSSLDGNLRMPSWTLDGLYAKQGGGGGTGVSKTIPGTAESLQVLPADPGSAITAMALSADRTKLYVGTSVGTLRVYAWPPEALHPSSTSTSKAQHDSQSQQAGTADGGAGPGSKPNSTSYYEIYTHAGPVVAIKLSPIDHTVISAGADGSVFVHSDVEVSPHKSSAGAGVGGSGGGGGGYDMYDTFSDIITLNDDVVLMSAEDIEEHINDVVNLQKELLETKNKNEFHARKVASDHAETIKLMIEQHDNALNKEKESSDNYKAAAEKRISDFANSVEAKDADNQLIRTELENKYEHKLAESLQRYDQLSEKMQLLKQKCEGLLESEKVSFNKHLNELKMEAHNKEKKLKTDHRRAVEDKTANEAAFMEILKQQEDEYEDELKQMIDSVNFELASERETILKLRTLVQTKNTKLAQLKKKLIELNGSAQAHAARVVEEVNARKQLLATIEHYKKNLAEREAALAEKEKDVLELRSTTRTLENFRFVLDHRLQQLSSERGPITMHIEGLEKHISTMYEELVEEFSSKKASNEAAVLKDQKINWISQDLNKMRQSVREKDQYITAFKRELNNIVSSMVVGKELEESVKLLYKKFVRGESESKKLVKISDHIMDKVTDIMHAGGHNDADDTHSMLSMDTNDNKKGFVSMAAGTGGGGGGGGSAGAKHAVESSMANEIDEALVETAKEADRQKKFVERQSNNLRHRLLNTKKEAHSLARHRLNENSNLLFECNDLRMEVKELNRKLTIKRNELDLSQRMQKELKAQLSVASRPTSTERHHSPKTGTQQSRSSRIAAGGGGGANVGTVRTTTNPSAVHVLPAAAGERLEGERGGGAQEEEEEEEMEVEMQQGREQDEEFEGVSRKQGDAPTGGGGGGAGNSSNAGGPPEANAQQWIVNNAIHRPGSPQQNLNNGSQAMTSGLQPVKGRGGPVVKASMRNGKSSALSQSTPNLNAAAAAANIAQNNANNASSIPELGVGKTKTLSAVGMPRAAVGGHLQPVVAKPLAAITRRKTSSALSSSLSGNVEAWQVNHLTKEVTNLASQLDESLRERELQRLEISKLKKMIMSTSAPHNASQQSPLLLSPGGGGVGGRGAAGPGGAAAAVMMPQTFLGPAGTPASAAAAAAAPFNDDAVDGVGVGGEEEEGGGGGGGSGSLAVNGTGTGAGEEGGAVSNAYTSSPALNMTRKNSGRHALSPKRFSKSPSQEGSAGGGSVDGGKAVGGGGGGGGGSIGTGNNSGGGANSSKVSLPRGGATVGGSAELNELSLHSAASAGSSQ